MKKIKRKIIDFPGARGFDPLGHDVRLKIAPRRDCGNGLVDITLCTAGWDEDDAEPVRVSKFELGQIIGALWRLYTKMDDSFDA